MATSSAHANHYRLPPCDLFSTEACGHLIEQPSTSNGRRVVLRDTSPTYMKQTDPRYVSSMRDAGGGGGGGDGGGGGGGGR